MIQTILNTYPPRTKAYRTALAIHRANVIARKRQMMLQEDWSEKDPTMPSSRLRGDTMIHDVKKFINPFRCLIP